MREIIRRKGDIEARIFARCVAGHNECIVWTGYKDRQGYGKIRWLRNATGVHRAILQSREGRVFSSNEFVLHSCDNPSCCNPNHLRVGTLQENSAEMMKKQRSARGEKCVMSKLTDDIVRYIRENSDGLNYPQLGKMFGVDRNTIYCIRARKTWKHVS